VVFFNAAISVISVLTFYPLVFLGPLAMDYWQSYRLLRWNGPEGCHGNRGAFWHHWGFNIWPNYSIRSRNSKLINRALNTKFGALFNSILDGYLIIQIIVVVNMVFGALGGLIGLKLK
jgi:hypothetical protein